MKNEETEELLPSADAEVMEEAAPVLQEENTPGTAPEDVPPDALEVPLAETAEQPVYIVEPADNTEILEALSVLDARLENLEIMTVSGNDVVSDSLVKVHTDLTVVIFLLLFYFCFARIRNAVRSFSVRNAIDE